MSLEGLLSTILHVGNESLLVKETATVVSVIHSDPTIFTTADAQNLHKYQTRLSGLLKSKDPNVRWAALHVCKVSIQNSWEILQSHGATWAGIIQSLIDRSETTIVHWAAIDAAGIIFAETHGKPELTRTITTPRLPQYIKSLLNLSNKNPDLIFVAIRNLKLVLRNQSTTFRPFSNKFKGLLIEILNTAIVEPHKISDQLLTEACECFSCIHMSAVKGSEPDMWRSQLLDAMREFHATLDLFISPYIDEDIPNDPVVSGADLMNLSTITEKSIGGVGQDLANSSQQDMIFLTKKLKVIVEIIKALLTNPTKVQVRIPFGSLQNLTERVIALNRMTDFRRGANKLVQHLFFNFLEIIQVEIVKLNLDIIFYFNSAFIPHANSLLHYINIQVNTTNNLNLKLHLFELTGQLVALCGTPNMTMTSYVGQIVTPALKLLDCDSVRPIANLADSISNPAAFERSMTMEQKQIISKMLVGITASIPDLSSQLRAKIDRLFILHNHYHGMETSSLYPGLQSKYSIAAIAIRQDPESTLLSSLMHPRFPPLSQATQKLSQSYRLEDLEASKMEKMQASFKDAEVNLKSQTSFTPRFINNGEVKFGTDAVKGIPAHDFVGQNTQSSNSDEIIIGQPTVASFRDQVDQNMDQDMDQAMNQDKEQLPPPQKQKNETTLVSDNTPAMISQVSNSTLSMTPQASNDTLSMTPQVPSDTVAMNISDTNMKGDIVGEQHTEMDNIDSSDDDIPMIVVDSDSDDEM